MERPTVFERDIPRYESQSAQRVLLHKIRILKSLPESAFFVFISRRSEVRPNRKETSVNHALPVDGDIVIAGGDLVVLHEVILHLEAAEDDQNKF
jgi:hypothetical protein